MRDRDPAATARAYAGRALHRAGLLGPLHRWRRNRQLRGLSDAPEQAPDGLPVPPPRLRFTTCENPDLEAFLAGGRDVAAVISAALAERGTRVEELGSILDFGCGCGRVIRTWAPLERIEVHGSDYNPELVEWCEANLAFASFIRNGLAPPLPHADAGFDLVYAISVFTHLPVELQLAWAAELRRVLRPGGLLFFTVHGDIHARDSLLRGELSRFEAGEPVVIYEKLAGGHCAAFAPHAFVAERLLEGFSLLSFEPQSEMPALGQDVYLARRAG